MLWKVKLLFLRMLAQRALKFRYQLINWAQVPISEDLVNLVRVVELPAMKVLQVPLRAKEKKQVMNNLKEGSLLDLAEDAGRKKYLVLTNKNRNKFPMQNKNKQKISQTLSSSQELFPQNVLVNYLQVIKDFKLHQTFPQAMFIMRPP